MDVLTKSVPFLDPNDVQGSLKRIYDYLYNTMEQIDYTLARQGVQLGKVSLPATAAQIQQLAGQVSALASGVAVVTGTVGVLTTRLNGCEDDVAGLTQRLNQAEAAISTQAGLISALTQRVEALEENTTGG